MAQDGEAHVSWVVDAPRMQLFDLEMFDPLAPDATYLIELANYRMPFGKYAGRLLLDLPQAYLSWFAQRGFPKGKLGEHMALTLEIKHNGLEHLVRPLRRDKTP